MSIRSSLKRKKHGYPKEELARERNRWIEEKVKWLVNILHCLSKKCRMKSRCMDVRSH